jgi:hypothetical protein
MTANNQEGKDRQEQLLSRVNFENCISTIVKTAHCFGAIPHPLPSQIVM